MMQEDDGAGGAVDPAQHDSDEDDFEPAREYDSSDSDDGNDGDTSMGGDDQPMDDQRFAQITGTLLDMFPAPPARQLTSHPAATSAPVGTVARPSLFPGKDPQHFIARFPARMPQV